MKNPISQIFGRQGGLAKSERKAATSRANGRKGGRPRKYPVKIKPIIPLDTVSHS